MAKKTKKVEVEEPQVEETVTMEPPKVTVKKPIEKKTERFMSTDLEKDWEIRDRQYYLKKGLTPMSYSLRSSNIFWFDEKKGHERELKCTSNQRSPFVDEFPKGSTSNLEHIIFRNGVLHVPRNKQVLQKLLSLYHPDRKTRYSEKDYQMEAATELDWLEFEAQALNLALTIEIDLAEAIMRAEIGSRVSKMSSKEIKRDLLLFAKNNPKLFIDLVQDENILLRNFGIKATELGILQLSQDQRSFTWASTGRKIMNVPFDEHPYSALAAWFKTDEGMEIYQNIEKRLK